MWFRTVPLEGRFVGELVVTDRPDEAVTGNFVFRDDPLERQVSVLLGPRTGNILLGTYEAGFNGTSVWETV